MPCITVRMYYAPIKHEVNGTSPHHQKTYQAAWATNNEPIVTGANVELNTKQDKNESPRYVACIALGSQVSPTAS